MNKPKVKAPKQSTFLTYFEELIQDMEECDDRELSGSLRLGESKIRVPEPEVPVELLLGGEDGFRLQLQPELVLDAKGDFHPSGDYLVLDPTRFFDRISGFVRLSAGASLMLGRKHELQRLLLSYPRSVSNKHLRLKLTENGLTLKNKAPKQGACLAPLTRQADLDRMRQWRLGKLQALSEWLQTPIAEPPPEQALDLLQQVVALMADEPYRLKTQAGRPGGVLHLPSKPTPILIGDLHARIDNLLVLLTQNAFLEGLKDGSAMLIFAGDAVHADAPGQEGEMAHSMWMMDLIFRLKLAFPDRVFYLRGNHDDFSEDIIKAGVPQGLLWEKALRKHRGEAYRNAMASLYDRLPYLAYSSQFICCHAGAPTMKYGREDLIDLARKPKLKRQLTNLRMRKTGSPDGYGQGDVRRLRKRLGVADDTPFIVGHTPLSTKDSLWMNVGGIPNHHVLYGSNPKRIGVLTRPDKELLPLAYPAEPLLELYNRRLQDDAFILGEPTHRN